MDPVADIPWERLFEAAEASITAALEVAYQTGGPTPWPPDLMGSPLQPECLADFTRAEIEQACAFLVRLGFMVWPTPPVKARRRDG